MWAAEDEAFKTPATQVFFFETDVGQPQAKAKLPFFSVLQTPMHALFSSHAATRGARGGGPVSGARRPQAGRYRLNRPCTG